MGEKGGNGCKNALVRNEPRERHSDYGDNLSQLKKFSNGIVKKSNLSSVGRQFYAGFFTLLTMFISILRCLRRKALAQKIALRVDPTSDRLQHAAPSPKLSVVPLDANYEVHSKFPSVGRVHGIYPNPVESTTEPHSEWVVEPPSH